MTDTAVSVGPVSVGSLRPTHGDGGGRLGYGAGVDPAEARRRFVAARVARFASVRPDGRPHLTPVTFARTGDDTVVWAVDHKPKAGRDLQRLRNIAHQPEVSLLVDHYDDDWRQLWWARADGTARVLRDGGERESAVDALVQRYAPYRDHRPEGPVVATDVHRWAGWSASA